MEDQRKGVHLLHLRTISIITSLFLEIDVYCPTEVTIYHRIVLVTRAGTRSQQCTGILGHYAETRITRRYPYNGYVRW
jgi:hypothetical protein